MRHDTARITELNQWVAHTRETAELRLQAEQMGRSMVEWLKNRGHVVAEGDPRLGQCAALKPAPTWPVAFALAVAQCLPASLSSTASVPPDIVKEALLSFAFGWAENMVQAAIKSVPLGQSAGQRILQALLDDIPAAIGTAIALPDRQRQAFTPLLAILSSQHESQYSRLFRS
jgi:urease accessory protein